jgi:hypothetical protein
MQNWILLHKTGGGLVFFLGVNKRKSIETISILQRKANYQKSQKIAECKLGFLIFFASTRFTKCHGLFCQDHFSRNK